MRIPSLSARRFQKSERPSRIPNDIVWKITSFEEPWRPLFCAFTATIKGATAATW